MSNLSPFFCDKCQEIRNVDQATLLQGYEDLQYKSFSMCSLCREYINIHSEEEVRINKIKYAASLIHKEAIKKTISEKNITLYYIEKINTMNTLNSFINNLISPYKFSNYSI